jgi:dienelactone hydrolase
MAACLKRTFCGPLGLALLAGLAGAEPSKRAAGDEMIEAYLRRDAKRLDERFLGGAATREEWEARRPRLRREYLDMLGLWPLPGRTPLHATVTGTVDRGGVVVEKLHYQSRPGLYVTGNLYRPKKAGGRLPAVLYVCGHSPRGRDGNKTAFQDHGMWFAANGYVCLVVDTLQLGEVAGVHHGTYNLGRMWWQAAGYTPAGVECWNGVRGLDYLCGRPDVDPERLGVTGISGGGATTFWVAAADERVKCAVPVSGMSDLESYVGDKVVNGHCDCMFLVNTYGWGWATIAALVAPRPLLFVNSDADSIFPMDGNRRVAERLRRAYRLLGKPELFDDYVSKGGHAYRPDLRLAVFGWMNKHLKNDTSPVQDGDAAPLPGKELRVFPEDKDLPADAINSKVDETFVARGVATPPETKDFDAWKKDTVKRLREVSFRTFPDRVPAAVIADKGVESGQAREVTTEPGIRIGLTASRGEWDAGRPRTVFVVGPKDGDGQWRKPYEARAGYYLEPRGVHQKWERKSPPNFVERAHALIGRTVDEGRVWDIAATLRDLHESAEGKPTFRVVGRGRSGVLAAYAALFEPSVEEVVVVDPPASHRDGPYFLGVLRVLDVPDALGLLAPKPLTLVNAKDKAFDRTELLYRLAGAAGKLQRK